MATQKRKSVQSFVALYFRRSLIHKIFRLISTNVIPAAIKIVFRQGRREAIAKKIRKPPAPRQICCRDEFDREIMQRAKIHHSAQNFNAYPLSVHGKRPIMLMNNVKSHARTFGMRKPFVPPAVYDSAAPCNAPGNEHPACAVPKAAQQKVTIRLK